MSDIVDTIDALVDAQLADGPQDDYNADRYDRCPHCDRHWHGLPVTERIAAMYRFGVYDETYSAADDDSRVLCRGSDFIGPMPPEQRIGTHPHAPWVLPDDPFNPANWGIERFTFHAPQALPDGWEGLRHEWIVVTAPDDRRWWRLPQVPEDVHLRFFRTFEESNARITLSIGDERFEWAIGRVYFERFPNGIRTIVDVLAEHTPTIGGTWEPISAPGSLLHPDDLNGEDNT